MGESPRPSLAGLRKVSKHYGAVRALSDVSIEFHASQLHALLGENGSGKSTLVKLLAGATQPTEGVVTLGGADVQIASPHDAISRGIVTIFQQSQTVPDLTVGENIILGHERSRFGVLAPRQFERAREILASLDSDLALDRPVRTLSVASQQVVSIARALSQSARLLILDEPTASLGQVEAEQLYARVRLLRDRGLGIVYITHRMAEVEMLADVVSVLKDGQLMATRPASGLSERETIRLMVGRDLDQLFPELPPVTDRVILRARELGSVGDSVFIDRLDLHEGEIVGIAGLEGSGRATLARILGGVERPASGTLEVDGVSLAKGTPRKSLNGGLAFVPPDRLHDGIIPAFSVRASITQAGLPLLARGSIIRSTMERRAASDQIGSLQVKTRSPEANILTLSGGNQQKVLLARGLCARARVLVMDEPTAGVDVGARGDIYEHISTSTENGMGVIISSSDMVELMGICHRILVVREGRVVAEMPAHEATEESLMVAQLPDTASREINQPEEVPL